MAQDDWRSPEGGTSGASPSPRRDDTPTADPFAPPTSPRPLPGAESGEASEAIPAYGTPPADATPPGHGTPPAYGTPPGYATPPAYGTPPPYGTPPGYGAPAAYGAPTAYGTPAGYPPYQGYGYARSRTSGFAVAGFVLSLVWIFWLGSVLAVIFGHIALGEIKRDPSIGGRGLAIAGLVIGYGALALFVLALLGSSAMSAMSAMSTMGS